MRPEFAGLIAAAERSRSPSTALASAQIVLSEISVAISLTASKSPWLAAGKPASITSTRILSSKRAMAIFSSAVMDAPGLCSPSRKVVSKIINLFDMVCSNQGSGCSGTTQLSACCVSVKELNFGVRVLCAYWRSRRAKPNKRPERG